MADGTRLVRDDVYEEVGATYQCVLVEMLDEALQEHGVSKPSVRRKIAEAFLFNLGNFHDQCWFMADGKPYYPVLCFSTKFLNVDTPADGLGTVLAPSPMFALHEYASGSVDAFYEGGPESRVETGSFGQLDDSET